MRISAKADYAVRAALELASAHEAGEPVKGDGRPIYSERFIHSEIYKARPDVNSVVHTHSPTVVPFLRQRQGRPGRLEAAPLA